MSKYNRPRSVGWSDEEVAIIVRCAEEDRTILEVFSRLNKDYQDVIDKVREVLGRDLRGERSTGSAI